MSFKRHFLRLIGYPRRQPVTRASVRTASPPPNAIDSLLRAQDATKELIIKLDETRRLARSVEQELASEALRIVRHRGV